MSLISMMEANLPPGFRFHPRDEELVMDYLYPKLTGGGGGEHYGGVAMVDVDLNKCEPWELPDAARVGARAEWYFFSLHDRKYATGQRTNRATVSGYWKATGKDRAIHLTRRRRHGVAAAAVVVGMRKTLVFYEGRAPRGSKTEWVMHEFRVDGRAVADHPSSSSSSTSSSLLKEDWVLCRVFYKSRTATPRPASGEAGVSISSELSLPPPLAVAPAAVVDAYLAMDRAPAADIVVGVGYYEQDSSGYGHHRPLPETALPFKDLTDFRELLSGHGGGGGAKAEGFYLGWSEEEAAGFVQQQSAMASQAWNPF